VQNIVVEKRSDRVQGRFFPAGGKNLSACDFLNDVGRQFVTEIADAATVKKLHRIAWYSGGGSLR
jgi:hypothetical protein